MIDQFDFSGSDRLALKQVRFADFGEDDLQELRNRRADHIEHLSFARLCERNFGRLSQRIQEIGCDFGREWVEFQRLEIINGRNLAQFVQHAANAYGTGDQKSDVGQLRSDTQGVQAIYFATKLTNRFDTTIVLTTSLPSSLDCTRSLASAASFIASSETSAGTTTRAINLPFN